MSKMIRSRKATLMLTGASALALSFVTAGFAQTYDFSTSIDEDEVLRLIEANTAWASAVEGATTQRVAQVGAIIVNSIALTGDWDEGDTVRIGMTPEVEEEFWSMNSININAATAIAGDALAGGSQTATIAFNTTSIASVGEAATFGLDQSVFLDDDDDEAGLDLLALNLMFAGSAVGGTAIIDADMDASAEVVRGEQIASVAMNTARFSTESSDLIVNLLDTQEVDAYNDYDAEANLVSSNLAIAYAPTPMFGDGDPAVRNLNQTAAVALNTISMSVAGENGARGQDAYLVLGNEFDSDDEGQRIEGDDFNDGFELVFENNIAATTFQRYDETRDFLTSWGNYGEDNFNAFDNDGLDALEDAGQAVFEVFFGEDSFRGIDGVGDVDVRDVQQTASLAMNTIAFDGEGTLFIDNLGDDVFNSLGGEDFFSSVGEDFLSSFQQELDDIDLDSFGNKVVAETGTGDGRIVNVDQIISIRGNTLSSAGDLQFSVLGLFAENEGEDSGADYAFEQWMDDIDVASGTENDIDVEVDFGDVIVDNTSQIFLVAFNSISAGSSYEEDGEDNDVSVGGDIKGYFDQWAENTEFDLDNVVKAEVDERGTVTLSNLEQVISASQNTLSATGTFEGILMQEIYDNDEDFDIRNSIRAEGDGQGGTVSIAEASQVGFLNLNTARIAGSASGLIDQNFELDDSDELIMLNETQADTTRNGFASIATLDQTLVASVNTVTLGTLEGGEGLTVRQNFNDDESRFSLVNTALASVDHGIVGFGADDRIATLTDVTQTAVLRANAIISNVTGN